MKRWEKDFQVLADDLIDMHRSTAIELETWPNARAFLGRLGRLHEVDLRGMANAEPPDEKVVDVLDISLLCGLVVALWALSWIVS